MTELTSPREIDGPRYGPTVDDPAEALDAAGLTGEDLADLVGRGYAVAVVPAAGGWRVCVRPAVDADGWHVDC